MGGFQNPGVCLQAFPSFLPLHSSPCNSLLPNCTETLATQAIICPIVSIRGDFLKGEGTTSIGLLRVCASVLAQQNNLTVSENIFCWKEAVLYNHYLPQSYTCETVQNSEDSCSFSSLLQLSHLTVFNHTFVKIYSI